VFISPVFMAVLSLDRLLRQLYVILSCEFRMAVAVHLLWHHAVWYTRTAVPEDCSYRLLQNIGLAAAHSSRQWSSPTPKYFLFQLCTNPGSQFALATKVCVVAPSFWRSSVWKSAACDSSGGYNFQVASGFPYLVCGSNGVLHT